MKILEKYLMALVAVKEKNIDLLKYVGTLKRKSIRTANKSLMKAGIRGGCCNRSYCEAGFRGFLEDEEPWGGL